MKITLCGSTRFMERYHTANRALTLQGHVVYSVATISTSHVFKENEHDKGGRIEPAEITLEQKTLLDLVHLKKILESDAIVVIGWRGLDDDYAGESTRREVAWALMHDKEVYRESSIRDLELINNDGHGAITEVLQPGWPKSADVRRTACGDPRCTYCTPAAH